MDFVKNLDSLLKLFEQINPIYPDNIDDLKNKTEKINYYILNDKIVLDIYRDGLLYDKIPNNIYIATTELINILVQKIQAGPGNKPLSTENKVLYDNIRQVFDQLQLINNECNRGGWRWSQRGIHNCLISDDTDKIYFDIYKCFEGFYKQTKIPYLEVLYYILNNFGSYKGQLSKTNVLAKIKLLEEKISNNKSDKINNLENKIKSLENKLSDTEQLENKIKSLEEKMLQKFKSIDEDYEYAVDHFETQFNERDNIYNLDTKLRINDLEDDMLQKNAQINAINAKLNVIYYATKDNKINKIKLLEEQISNKDNQIKELNSKLDNFINSQNTINNLTSQMINNFNCCG